MIKKIAGYLQRLRNNKTTLVSAEQSVSSIWEDTGQVLYLENTFKLTYTSNSGLVTLEKLSMQELPAAIKQLAELPSDSPLAKASVGANDTAFNISVCAVTWQKSGDSVRIKAVPEAALLRSCTSCFSRSQAVFKHEFLLEHDDNLSATLNNKPGVFTYDRISIEQFTQQIALANSKVQKALASSVSVKAENFDSAFTEHEIQTIEKVLSHDSAGDANHERITQ